MNQTRNCAIPSDDESNSKNMLIAKVFLLWSKANISSHKAKHPDLNDVKSLIKLITGTHKSVIVNGCTSSTNHSADAQKVEFA